LQQQADHRAIIAVQPPIAGNEVVLRPRIQARVIQVLKVLRAVRLDRVVDLLERMASQEERPQWKILADAITERAERLLK
jgi:hypothetical protein